MTELRLALLGPPVVLRDGSPVTFDTRTISRAAVALKLAAVQVDVREFEALITRPDAESLERAVGLYRDDFLSGFVLRGCPDFEEWQASVSEGLRQALVEW
jgi:DNA-binding SARP family transcriptional activator